MFVHHLKSVGEFKLLQSVNSNSYSPEKLNSIRVKIGNFLSRVTLKFHGWHWKTIGQLFYTTSSFVHHFKVMGEFKLVLQCGNAQFGSKRQFFIPCELKIWWMTLEKNRAPLLYYVKLCASFQIHRGIHTGVTVWKRSIRVKVGNYCPVYPRNLGEFELEFQSGNAQFGSKSIGFLSRLILKILTWPPKIIGHLF